MKKVDELTECNVWKVGLKCDHSVLGRGWHCPSTVHYLIYFLAFHLSFRPFSQLLSPCGYITWSFWLNLPILVLIVPPLVSFV